MKSQSPVEAELSWAQVHAFRLTRHHLARRASKKDLVRVIGDIGGVQAQVMSAAELQVVVRADAKVTDVRDALWKRKTLAKTWLMRGTLHLIPSDDLPLFTAAMRRMRVNNSWLKYIQMNEKEFWGLIDSIGEALDGQALTREELIAKVGKGRSEHVRSVLKSGWGGILKPVARRGLLCFGPSRGQSVTFVRPQQWLAGWREMDPDAALTEVARRYLRAYGPATKKDFSSWWGHWPGVGNAGWSGVANELAPVSVEGHRADILVDDLDRIAAANSESSVDLLPGFDPYLMGHATRDHLFAAEHRSRVSRTAGWISAVVLNEGRVVATWTHQVSKRLLTVTVDPFRTLAPATFKAVCSQADSLAEALDLEQAAVQIA